MTDEKYLFVSDSIEKKKTGNSARNRRTHNGKGGKAKLPCDYMTKKELEAMNGDCVSYRLNEPMTWAGFKSMPDDIQRDYIRLLRQKYGVTNTDLADMFGAQRPTVSAHLSKLGLEHSKKGAHVADAEGWNRFLGRQTEQAEEEPLPEQQEEAHETDAETEEKKDSTTDRTVVPQKGEMTFCGDASDILDTAKRILSGSKLVITIVWSEEEIKNG